MTVEEIKQSTTMRDVLAKYGIKVNRNGMCCCPIHQERHPSMQVFNDGYKCYACQSNGDIFTFVQEMEHCDFKTAFMILGGSYKEHRSEITRANIKTHFDRKKKEAQRREREEKRFYHALIDAIEFCKWWIANREPFSDDWCYAQNNILLLWDAYEAKYIQQEEVNEIDVYRTCRKIEQRFLAF